MKDNRINCRIGEENKRKLKELADKEEVTITSLLRSWIKEKWNNRKKDSSK